MAGIDDMRAEHDLDVLLEAKQIRSDAERFSAAKELARQKRSALSNLTRQKNTGTSSKPKKNKKSKQKAYSPY